MYTITLKECIEPYKPPAACSFLQTYFWASFKALHGWTFKQYIVTVDDTAFLLTILLRPLSPFGILGYVPMGPHFLTDANMPPETAAHRRGIFLPLLAKQLYDVLPDKVFLLRFDPPWECVCSNNKNEATGIQRPLFPRTEIKTAMPLFDAPADIQPPDTVQLDLTKPLETLLQNCKPKWRYNIRLAEKKGVVVRSFFGNEAAEKGVPLFYPLYLDTAARDGIAVHSESYYRSLCTLAAHNSSTVSITVYTAFFEEKPLASIIVLLYRHEAVYLYGASSNEYRNLMPSYLLQWRAICDAQKAGCRTYDFYGIPPTDDPAHPMHGLYRFKTGFGGMIIRRIGSIDIPSRRIRYLLYKKAEQLRSWWFKKIKKKFKKR